MMSYYLLMKAFQGQIGMAFLILSFFFGIEDFYYGSKRMLQDQMLNVIINLHLMSCFTVFGLQKLPCILVNLASFN